MKITTLVLSALAMVLSSIAVAQESSSGDSSKDLQNLVYYSHEGEFLFSGLLAASINDNESRYDTAGGLDSNNRFVNYLTLGLTYGLSDRWRINVSEQYLIWAHNEFTETSNGALSAASSNGFSDPTFTFAYRWINGEEGRLYSDLALVVKPSLGPARSAAVRGDSSQTGNNLSGDWTTGVELPLFWRWNTNELQVTPRVTYNFGGQTEGISASGTSTRSQYWTESISVADRYHFSDTLYLQPSVSLELPYSINSTNDAGGTNTTQTNAVPTWELSAGYLPRPNCLLNLNFTYHDDVTMSVPSAGLINHTKVAQTLLSGQVRFVF